jgi:glucose-6-phosphate isomerase, archaeal
MKLTMSADANRPSTFEIVQAGSIVPSRFDQHIVRRLSDLDGQFLEEQAYRTLLSLEDSPVYEVYGFQRPEVAGELLHGLSIVHPGKVGSEYFMTKGHYHVVLDTAEIYYCLQGEGFMVMETPDGEWEVVPLRKGTVLYVPPRWAHRSINTHASEDLVTFFAFPGNAGHDYESIEKNGFRKLVVERDGAPQVTDNPHWIPPEARR